MSIFDETFEIGDERIHRMWDPRRPRDERRAEVAANLAEYLDEPDSYWGKFWRERAEWTDAQWDAHDAEITAKIEEERQQKEQARQRKHWNQLLGAGWALRALQVARNADLEHPAIKRVIEWNAEAESNILLLAGVAGCGKTVASARWALVDRLGHETLFVRASSFARSSRFDKDTRERWLDANALVLDDLGAEFADAKGSLQVDLDELFDTFYGNRRPLIVTTNLTAAQFKARYGERIADRLRECGTWFGVAGASLRGKGN